MLTRTSGLSDNSQNRKTGGTISPSLASELALHRIFLNSVDTGWITDERPFSQRQRDEEKGFSIPLDEVDAAMRILVRTMANTMSTRTSSYVLQDPIFVGYTTGVNHYGKFWKDYVVADW